MKLLIISSEPLNPEDTYRSIFELSQASILKDIADVCILSVSPLDTFSAKIKRKLSKFKAGSSNEIVPDDLTKSVKTGRVQNYIIEGTPVIEGRNFRLYTKGNFFVNLESWVKAGLNAFKKYSLDHGFPDIIHAHGRFLNAGVLANRIYKKHGIPFVYTEHSTAYRTGVAPIEGKRFLLEIFKNASAVTTVSKSLLKDVENYLGKSVNSVQVLPNAVDPIFETPINLNKNFPEFQFINISSFHKKKGVDILLHSFKRAFDGDPLFRLTICGDGDLRDEIIQLTKQLGLHELVTFTGLISKAVIKDKLDASNVLVVSSLHETFGVVVIEALSRGCPVVSTICGGPEEIINNEYGLLVEPGDINAMSNSLKKMARDYSHYDAMKIRHSILEKYGRIKFLQSSVDLYQSIIRSVN